MDSENYSIPEETATVVNNALDNNKKVFAVGTSKYEDIRNCSSASKSFKI